MKKSIAIMLIDDSLSDRRLFQYVLNEINSDIKYIPIENGTKAIDYLSSSDYIHPDYIFLDVNMPGMNGIECLERIKKIKSVKHIPVIVYSTDPLKNYEEAAMSLGAYQCLRKSIDFNETCKVIKSLLQEENNNKNR
jgi:CheY-like chemotaxis protein